MSPTSTAGTVVLACVACAGALLAWPPPIPVLLAIATAGAVTIAIARPTSGLAGLVVIVGVFVLTSGLAHRSLAGLDATTAGPIEGRAVLVSDPEPHLGAVRADLRLGRVRVEAWARGSAGATLERRLAGESVRVSGRLRPLAGRTAAQTARHLAGRADLDSVADPGPGPVPVRVANGLRRLLDRGARDLDPDTRSLFAGFVVGDDRFQDAVVADEFRAVGLTHLLAVSGQNVAFLLAVVTPLLRRLPLWPRVAATLAVLAFFALVTRFEPSVLRATTMAGLSVGAAAIGRESQSFRLLALAVVALLVVDPLLVHALAFRLSVGASAGILAVTSPLARHLPGPRAVVLPFSVTVAAQIGTAPFVLAAFGGIPVASLPANLLAVPLAGPVMVWGLLAGPVAGLCAEPLPVVLHLPTRVLIGAIRAVAHHGAGLGLGSIGVPVALGLGGLGLAAGAASRHGAPGVVRGALVVATGLVLGVGLGPAPQATTTDLAPGAQLWRGSTATVLVLGSEARAAPTLEGLRGQRVRHVDAVVLTARGLAVVDAADAVQRSRGSGVVLATGPAPLEGLTVAEAGSTWEVGGVTIVVEQVEPTVEVRVGSDRAVGARDPPVRHHDPGGRDGHPQPHA